MKILNQIKWVLGIAVIFVVILATNLIDKQNFTKANKAITSIYEDRLIAKGILLDITILLQQKEVAFLKTDTVFLKNQNVAVNNIIQEKLVSFEQTAFVGEETRVFEDLKNNISKLNQLEITGKSIHTDEPKILLNQLKLIKSNIAELAEIQLKEGKRELSNAQRALDSVDLFTTMEIYLLIALAIVIQAIVIYSSRKTS